MGDLQHGQEDQTFKILVVDDNPDDRTLYERLLQKSRLDCQIYEAGTVSEGLAIACEKAPDCIILDYQLPDGDGIGFINAYREKSAGPMAAIVMITGQGSEKTAVEALKTGALDYISKTGLSRNFFVQNILNAIERSRLRNQVRQYQHELEKSNRALSDFTHTVSHDLKAPLRRIISYCGLLTEDVGAKLGPEARQYLDRLVVNSQRLHKLVEDLLSYSQLTHTGEEKKVTDLKTLVQEVIEDLGAAIKEQKATVTAGDLPTLSVYPVRIRQLFQNLLLNSLKYRSKENPVIAVQCEDKGSYCLFSIQDNGIGIAKEYHEKIFRDFERLHTQDQIEGSGLGLSICRKVTEMHKGKIWVESAPAKGSTFFFTI